MFVGGGLSIFFRLLLFCEPAISIEQRFHTDRTRRPRVLLAIPSDPLQPLNQTNRNLLQARHQPLRPLRIVRLVAHVPHPTKHHIKEASLIAHRVEELTDVGEVMMASAGWMRVSLMVVWRVRWGVISWAVGRVYVAIVIVGAWRAVEWRTEYEVEDDSMGTGFVNGDVWREIRKMRSCLGLRRLLLLSLLG